MHLVMCLGPIYIDQRKIVHHHHSGELYILVIKIEVWSIAQFQLKYNDKGSYCVLFLNYFTITPR